jgi:hypothetical protein
VPADPGAFPDTAEINSRQVRALADPGKPLAHLGQGPVHPHAAARTHVPSWKNILDFAESPAAAPHHPKVAWQQIDLAL